MLSLRSMLWGTVRPSHNGGSAITGYKVMSDLGSGGALSNTVATLGVVTTYTHTGLTGSTTYKYAIIATNAVGDSAAGSDASQATAAPIVPSQPAAPTSGAISDSDIVVHWLAPTSDGGSPISNYILYSDNGSGGALTPVSAGVGNVLNFTHSALTPSTAYRYQIVAENAVGTSLPSAIASFSTIASGPLVPGTPSFASITWQSASISWTPANPNGSPVTSYELAWDSGDGSPFTIVQTVGNVLTTSVTGLSSSTAYVFQVRANNTVGGGPWSASATLTTLSPSALAWVAQPGGTTSATVPFPVQPSVALVDATGLQVTDAAPVHLNLSLASGPVGSIMSVTADSVPTASGLANFAGVTTSLQGDHIFKVVGTGLPELLSSTISVGAPPPPPPPPPSAAVTGFTPSSTPALTSTSIALTGTNLDVAASVSVAGIPCTNLVVTSAAAASCDSGVSPGGALSGKISVTSNDGSSTESSDQFRWTVPTVTSVSPAQIVISAITAGTIVDIRGADLGTSDSDIANVQLARITCVNAAWVDPSHVTCTPAVPTFANDSVSSVSSAPTVRTTSGGHSIASVGVKFTYIRSPVVTSANPSFVDLANATLSMTITITGKYFIAGATTASVGAVPCTAVRVLTTTTLECDFAPDTGASGTVNMTVTTFGGAASTVGGTFVYLSSSAGGGGGNGGPGGGGGGASVAHVTSVFPPTVPTTGGLVVTISGVQFGSSGATLRNAYLAGVKCDSVTWVSSAEIKCVSGASSTATSGGVIVELAVSGNSTSVATISYVYPPPEIEGLYPRVGRRSGGTKITLIGTGFGVSNPASLEIYMEGQACSEPTWISATSISCRTLPETQVSPASSTIGFKVVINGASSATTPLVFEYKDDNRLCDPECPYRADCLDCESITNEEDRLVACPDPAILVGCVCQVGWAGTDCGSPIIFAQAINTHSSEDGGVAEFEVFVRQSPRGALSFTLESTDVTEGTLETSVLDIPPGTSPGTPFLVKVSGVEDSIRDGNVTFSVSFGPISSPADPRFAGVVIPDLKVINDDKAPVLIELLPYANSALNGTNITIVGRNFDPVFEIFLDDQPIARSNIRIVADSGSSSTKPNSTSWMTMLQSKPASLPAALSSQSQISLLQTPATDPVTHVAITTPPRTTEGYVTVTFRNGGGSMFTAANLLYYTDDCPEPGSYGKGNQCRACPENAVCPGGFRVHPAPGYWNSKEDSPEIIRCVPAEACLGGFDAGCAPGYSGLACAQCAPGYTKGLGDKCDPCPSADAAWQYVAADVVIWTILALCACGLKDRDHFYKAITFLFSLQILGAVGQLVGANLPEPLRSLYDFLGIFSGAVQFLRRSCENVDFNLEYTAQVLYAIVIGLPMHVGIMVVKYCTLWRLGDGKSAWARRCAESFQEINTLPVDFRRRVRDHYNDRHVRAITVHLSVTFYTMSYHALDALYCAPVGGQFRLVNHPEVVCFKDYHIGTAVLAFCVVLFHTVGWVIFQHYWYRENWDRMADDFRYADRWDAQYSTYNKANHQFWILDFAQLFALAVSASFLRREPFLQLCLLAPMFLVGIIVAIWRRPYGVWLYNWAIGIGMNFINLGSIVIIYLDKEQLLGRDEALGTIWFVAVLIIILILALLYIFVGPFLTNRVYAHKFAIIPEKNELSIDWDNCLSSTQEIKLFLRWLFCLSVNRNNNPKVGTDKVMVSPEPSAKCDRPMALITKFSEDDLDKSNPSPDLLYHKTRSVPSSSSLIARTSTGLESSNGDLASNEAEDATLIKLGEIRSSELWSHRNSEDDLRSMDNFALNEEVLDLVNVSPGQAPRADSAPTRARQTRNNTDRDDIRKPSVGSSVGFSLPSTVASSNDLSDPAALDELLPIPEADDEIILSPGNLERDSNVSRSSPWLSAAERAKRHWHKAKLSIKRESEVTSQLLDDILRRLDSGNSDGSLPAVHVQPLTSDNLGTLNHGLSVHASVDENLNRMAASLSEDIASESTYSDYSSDDDDQADHPGFKTSDHPALSIAAHGPRSSRSEKAEASTISRALRSSPKGRARSTSHLRDAHENHTGHQLGIGHQHLSVPNTGLKPAKSDIDEIRSVISDARSAVSEQPRARRMTGDSLAPSSNQKTTSQSKFGSNSSLSSSKEENWAKKRRTPAVVMNTSSRSIGKPPTVPVIPPARSTKKKPVTIASELDDIIDSLDSSLNSHAQFEDRKRGMNTSKSGLVLIEKLKRKSAGAFLGATDASPQNAGKDHAKAKSQSGTLARPETVTGYLNPSSADDEDFRMGARRDTDPSSDQPRRPSTDDATLGSTIN
eukprot:TRINITY_DN1298_c0_g1_i2.p1 TRINITY_DN1298_c0_g1~~TRINITY_DN1298_c0_g1_i2.p1  ORF type:complete len:2301 (+),score=155.89 TRINITY_DN1298_c0_g1_i2:1379-8281(+)